MGLRKKKEQFGWHVFCEAPVIEDGSLFFI
jgi:hypothetical protein